MSVAAGSAPGGPVSSTRWRTHQRDKRRQVRRRALGLGGRRDPGPGESTLRRRPRIGDGDFSRPAPAQALAAGGRGGGGEDGGGQDAGGDRRGAADPPAVLRGAGRLPRRLRVGLQPADAAHPAAGGPRGGAGDGPGRHLRPAVPDQAPAAAGDRDDGGGRRDAGAADRRAGPGRRRVRRLPAGAALGLAADHPRDRHHPGRPAPGGGDHLQPHPRAARRPEAALPLPLDRLPHPGERAADRGHAPPGHPGAPLPPGVRLHPGPAPARPLEGARDRRDAGLDGRPAGPGGAGAAASRRWGPPWAAS